MLPEQLPPSKKPEKIVQGTGWGYLISKIKPTPPAATNEYTPVEQDVSTNSLQPPPQEAH